MKPRLLFILSMLIFGSIGLFVRALPLSSGEIALYRAILAALSIALYIRLSGRPFLLQLIRPHLTLLLFTGLLMGLNWVLLFEAYRHTSLSVATLCYNMAALLVTLASPLLFKERNSRFQWLCLLMALLGLALIVGTDFSGGPGTLTGVLLGLAAAVLYAAVILLNKRMARIPGLQRTLAQFIGAIAALIPYALLSGGFHLGALSLQGAALMLVLGLFHTGLTYSWYFSAIGALKGREIALLSFLDPLVAVLLSALVLREPLSPLQALGGLMILLFSYLSERAGRQAAPAAGDPAQEIPGKRQGISRQGL